MSLFDGVDVRERRQDRTGRGWPSAAVSFEVHLGGAYTSCDLCSSAPAALLVSYFEESGPEPGCPHDVTCRCWSPIVESDLAVCAPCTERTAPGLLAAAEQWERVSAVVRAGGDPAALPGPCTTLRHTVEPLLAVLGYDAESVQHALDDLGFVALDAHLGDEVRIGNWADGTSYEFHFMPEHTGMDGERR